MKHLILFLLTFSCFTLSAQTWNQLQKIVPNDREVNDEFGNAVAISGDYAIIGAMREDDDGNGQNDAPDAGSAYIFKKNGSTWTQEAKLVAADRESFDFFGHTVAISGTYCIVGAHQEGVPANAGAAYIFERNGSGTWVQVNKLEAPVRKANDYFGFSVGISGDYAVVGAYFEDEDENESNEVLSAGSAYVFKRNNALNTWEFYQKIVASDRSVDDRFGMSVGISGDHIVVGAEFDDVDGSNGLQTNAGSAYVFKTNQSDVWEEEAHLKASDYGQSEHFGWSVAVSGDYAIVGAYQNDTDSAGMNSSPDAGAAYIFERGSGGWPQVKKIVASDRMNIDYYGFSVAIDGDQALVGAYRQNFAESGSTMYSDAGAAYVIKRNDQGEWLETQKINHGDRNTLDQFGYAVGMDENTIICGALTEDEDENIDNPLPEAGSVYFFNQATISTEELVNQPFIIYPNPASNTIFVALEDEKSYAISIVDIYGRLVWKDENFHSNSAIDISDLSSGTYFLFVQTQNEFFRAKKIVKH